MIKYLPLKQINDRYDAELREAVGRVMDSGWYLKGEHTQRFEKNYATYIGTKYCVGVANGLDALTLILRAYIEKGVMLYLSNIHLDIYISIHIKIVKNFYIKKKN